MPARKTAETPTQVIETVLGPQMRAIVARTQAFARRDMPILILGPTGVGKELVARAYAEEWCKTQGVDLAEYAVTNCTGFTEELLQSQLFGHARGAFTGAVGGRSGVVAAHRLICLDELGDARPLLQANVLRLVEYGDYVRLGEENIRRWDGRCIASTNKPDAVREDLRYRFHVVEVPPLCRRKDDFAELLSRYCDEYALERVKSRFVEWAVTHLWPGNVRELRRVCEEASVGDCSGPRCLDLPWAVPLPVPFSPLYGDPEPWDLSVSDAVAMYRKNYRPERIDEAAARAWYRADRYPSDTPGWLRRIADEIHGLRAGASMPAMAPDTVPAPVTSEAPPADAERARMEALLRERGSVAATAAATGEPESTLRARLKRLGVILKDVLPAGRRRRHRGGPTQATRRNPR